MPPSRLCSMRCPRSRRGARHRLPPPRALDAFGCDRRRCCNDVRGLAAVRIDPAHVNLALVSQAVNTPDAPSANACVLMTQIPDVPSMNPPPVKCVPRSRDVSRYMSRSSLRTRAEQHVDRPRRSANAPRPQQPHAPVGSSNTACSRSNGGHRRRTWLPTLAAGLLLSPWRRSHARRRRRGHCDRQ